ncbi:hypothetical protein G5B40_03620 [Pikeienuella piscinae]|uniref:DUF3311 domain-containing protein n=1 Tax=Pikeienuella piscinae TaxID=2748098 RepID=A0A7L5BXI7_9RHOB|nr:hypothetical protein [Pikeienuella piscinae]QIE54604.1 hypothetical protein G5B40_03620 [Pikeienuella piscinae]
MTEADMADKAAFKAERTYEAAMALPIAGLALFTPPLIGLFASDAGVFGVPMIVAYMFAAWVALVLCAYLLARRIKRANPDRMGSEGDA